MNESAKWEAGVFHIVAGAAMGLFAWGVLDKSWLSTGATGVVLMVIAGCGAGWAAWRVEVKNSDDGSISAQSACLLPLWLLGLMVVWRKLQIPHFGAWLLGVGGGGFLWMRIGWWSARQSGKKPSAIWWAVPLAATGAIVWEALSEQWDVLRLIVEIQVLTIILLFFMRFIRSPGPRRGSIAAITPVILAGGISWAAHGPHCNRLGETAAFRCYINSYDSADADSVGWKARRAGELRMVKINGVEKPAAVIKIPAGVIFEPSSPKSIDRFFVGMIEEAWAGEGDGVRFVFYVEQNGGWKKIEDRYIDPKHRRGERKWVEVSMKISGNTAGRKWKVETLPGPEVEQPFRRSPDERVDWATISAGIGN